MKDKLAFEDALSLLKEGKRVCRGKWGESGSFLWLKPAATIKSDWCKDPLLKSTVDENGGEIEALGTICMVTDDKRIMTGWVPSQEDMFSEDWMTFNK